MKSEPPTFARDGDTTQLSLPLENRNTYDSRKHTQNRKHTKSQNRKITNTQKPAAKSQNHKHAKTSSKYTKSQTHKSQQ